MNFIHNICKKKYKTFLMLFVVGVIALFSFLHLSHSVSAGTENNSTAIRITDEGFIPSFVEIRQGDTILFENISSRNVWPASNIHSTHMLYPGSDIRKCDSDEAEKIFDACKPIPPGESYAFTFNTAGVWRFHDHLFSSMSGEIVVQQGGNDIVKTKLQLPHLNFSERITIIISKIYFSVFPSRLSLSIGGIDFFEAAKDSKKLLFWMKVAGYDRVMDELVADSYRDDLDGTRVIQCHTQGHYVGRMAYQLHGVDIFENGVDERCQFGFYHGTLELFIGSLGSDDVVRRVAEQCGTYTDNLILRMFCEHGIGHGLVVYYDYNLPVALQKCFELNDLPAVELCYHGAFMENIFAGLGFAIGHNSLWINNKKPDYPCDELERLGYEAFVVAQCYFSQPLLWGWDNSSPYFDLKSAIDGCMRAPSYARVKCFAGLGFAAADASASLTDEQLIDICKQAPDKEARENCLARVLWVRSVLWSLSLDFWNPVLCSSLGHTNSRACNDFVRSFYTRFFERQY